MHIISDIEALFEKIKAIIESKFESHEETHAAVVAAISEAAVPVPPVLTVSTTPNE